MHLSHHFIFLKNIVVEALCIFRGGRGSVDHLHLSIWKRAFRNISSSSRPVGWQPLGGNKVNLCLEVTNALSKISVLKPEGSNCGGRLVRHSR